MLIVKELYLNEKLNCLVYFSSFTEVDGHWLRYFS